MRYVFVDHNRVFYQNVEGMLDVYRVPVRPKHVPGFDTTGELSVDVHVRTYRRETVVAREGEFMTFYVIDSMTVTQALITVFKYAADRDEGWTWRT